jgi:hypothetical protein
MIFIKAVILLWTRLMEWILRYIKKGTWTQIKMDEHGLKRIFVSPAADSGWKAERSKAKG